MRSKIYHSSSWSVRFGLDIPCIYAGKQSNPKQKSAPDFPLADQPAFFYFSEFEGKTVLFSS